MIKLYNDDCFNVFPSIEDASIDLVLCDMPYGTTACKWDIVIDLEEMWKHLERLCKPSAAIVLFGSEPFSSYLRMSNIAQFKYDWIWHKNTGSGFVRAKFSPLKYHEIISVFYKTQPIYNPQYQEYADSTKKRWKEGQICLGGGTNRTSTISDLKRKGSEISHKRGKYPESVQRFQSSPNASGKFHPTQKPIILMEYLIKTYSNENNTVLDFCMGSGTTGVACKNLNRSFVGIEKEKEYYDISVKRINEA